MTKYMKKKLKAIKVGTRRAALLFDRDEATIRRWCASGRLVARQETVGGPWEILLPEDKYRERLEMLDLTRN